VKLPTLTVKFAYNQSKPATSLLGYPTERVETITKVWQWKENAGPGAGGHCSETEEVPFLYFPVPDKSGRGFTIVLAWGFPFNPTGVRTDLGTGLESEFKANMGELGPEGAKIATKFDKANDAAKWAASVAAEALLVYLGGAASITVENGSSIVVGDGGDGGKGGKGGTGGGGGAGGAGATNGLPVEGGGGHGGAGGGGGGGGGGAGEPSVAVFKADSTSTAQIASATSLVTGKPGLNGREGAPGSAAVRGRAAHRKRHAPDTRSMGDRAA
jgi:hypothetical protein